MKAVRYWKLRFSNFHPHTLFIKYEILQALNMKFRSHIMHAHINRNKPKKNLFEFQAVSSKFMKMWLHFIKNMLAIVLISINSLSTSSVFVTLFILLRVTFFMNYCVVAVTYETLGVPYDFNKENIKKRSCFFASRHFLSFITQGDDMISHNDEEWREFFTFVKQLLYRIWFTQEKRWMSDVLGS